MGRTFLLASVVAAVLLIVTHAEVSARGRRGGCGGGGCSSGGCYTGGCYSGGCSTGGCYTGGYIVGGCATGTCAIGTVSACPGGVCVVPGSGSMMALVSTPIATAQATLVVALPADATLTVDGQATTSTSGERLFHTPALEQGSDYACTLKAEVVRAGQTQSIVRQVTVRAGQETRVDLTDSATTSVAAAQ